MNGHCNCIYVTVFIFSATIFLCLVPYYIKHSFVYLVPCFFKHSLCDWFPVFVSAVSCSPDHQYTCKSGQCIDIDWKCDTEFDCLDGSDEGPENGCSKSLVFPPYTYLYYYLSPLEIKNVCTKLTFFLFLKIKNRHVICNL